MENHYQKVMFIKVSGKKVVCIGANSSHELRGIEEYLVESLYDSPNART